MKKIKFLTISIILLASTLPGLTQTHTFLGQINGSGPSYVIVRFSIVRTFNYANDYAANTFGGQLAMMKTQAIQDFIEAGFDSTGPIPPSTFIWIGGYNPSSSCNGFVWLDNSPLTFTNWASSEPNLCSTQKCMEMKYNSTNGNYEWQSRECTISSNYFAVIEYGSTVPVDLTNFVANLTRTHNVELNWQTAVEINHFGFYIERSHDGKSWESVGFVEGSGNHNEIKNYQYLDSQPIPSINYYRLRMEDWDGKFEYSRVISVDVPINDNKLISIFPNPTKGMLEINFSKKNSLVIQVQIYNSNGLLVKELNLKKNQLDISNLPDGIYYMILNDGNQLSNHRIAKM